MAESNPGGMESGSRQPGSSWADEDEDDLDFVVEELADTDEEDEDEGSEEGSDSGSDLGYEPESACCVVAAGRGVEDRAARCALCCRCASLLPPSACGLLGCGRLRSGMREAIPDSPLRPPLHHYNRRLVG